MLPHLQTHQPIAHADLGFMRLSDAADYLALDVRSVRRFIAQGKLPGYRVGNKQLRVKYEDVKAFANPVPTVDPAA